MRSLSRCLPCQHVKVLRDNFWNQWRTQYINSTVNFLWHGHWAGTTNDIWLELNCVMSRVKHIKWRKVEGGRKRTQLYPLKFPPWNLIRFPVATSVTTIRSFPLSASHHRLSPNDFPTSKVHQALRGGWQIQTLKTNPPQPRGDNCFGAGNISLSNQWAQYEDTMPCQFLADLFVQ